MKLGAVFSGQGSQYAEMGKKLCDESNVARKIYEEASSILSYDLLDIYKSELDPKLGNTIYSQPAILTYSVASFKSFIEKYGWLPHFLAGHSVGEYAALVCAESISFENALKIVMKRGALMQESTQEGAMIAVIGLSTDEIENYCRETIISGGYLSISNYNTSTQTIVAGQKKCIEKAIPDFERMGATVKPLAVSIASHCAMMDDILSDFREELARYTFDTPHRMVLANVDGQAYQGNCDIQEKLVKQLVMPVQWVDIMRRFNRERVTHVIEFGPKKALRNFFKTDYPEINSYSIDAEDDMLVIDELLNSKSFKDKINIDFADRCMAAIACTQNCNNNNERYKENVILSSRKITTIMKTLEQADYDSQIKCDEVLGLLIQVLTGKCVSKEVLQRRLEKLFSEAGTMIQARCVYRKLNELK